ncbi:MAG TPA: hypothetical protein VG733_15970 [Chthoniobacteraceae bacterium]|nr:hypothetical protein [Chthoniobacteraceae bacterium]
MEEAPKKVIWVKVLLMLIVLVPFISGLCYFVYYYWYRGVTLAH